jgi:hypothetical protein
MVLGPKKTQFICLLQGRGKMAKFYKKTDETKAEPQDLVTITFVEDWEQAKDFEAMLKANDIPATLREEDAPEEDHQGYAVMVPADFSEEARIMIELQNAEDAFYDLMFEDEDPFDSELFDDAF